MPAPVVCGDATGVGELAAALVANRLLARPALRMLLPAGNTPLGMYAALRRLAADGRLGSARATVLQLDEYAGSHAFAAFLRRELDGVPLAALELIDGDAEDPAAEAARHRERLSRAPLDLAVLGLGMNGHVAFNEPGSDLDSDVRVVPLAATTLEAAGEPVPDHGITTGLRTLMRCRELFLLVTGEAKAAVLRAVLVDPPSPERPASLLRAHPRLTVVCDPAAASALRASPYRDARHAVIVLGHREPGISAEHRISGESLERLQRAERLVHRDPARVAILTGYTTTGGLSEAEQMALGWRDQDVPALLEVAGRDTAENASRSWPLVQALGGIDRVTVVTSFWHVRARFFFAAPYVRRGVEVQMRHEWRGWGWPRLLASEVPKLALARGERRAAWAPSNDGF